MKYTVFPANQKCALPPRHLPNTHPGKGRIGKMELLIDLKAVSVSLVRWCRIHIIPLLITLCLSLCAASLFLNIFLSYRLSEVSRKAGDLQCKYAEIKLEFPKKFVAKDAMMKRALYVNEGLDHIEKLSYKALLSSTKNIDDCWYLGKWTYEVDSIFDSITQNHIEDESVWVR